MLVAIVAVGFSINAYTGGRKCTGSKNCTACKNCKYCKYCSKEGGTCGVCR